MSRQAAGPHADAVSCVADATRAGVLLQHPLRLAVLHQAAEPASATEIAGRLGEARQKVNYHVRALADAGFLRRAERRRRGNLIEQRWVATARSYVLTPEVIAPLGADPRQVADELSADHLLALTARAQSDLAAVRRAAADEGRRLSTLSLAVDLCFESAEQRAAFAVALRDALTEVVARHSSPERGAGGEAGAGRPYRLLLGVHPRPPETPENDHQETPDGRP